MNMNIKLISKLFVDELINSKAEDVVLINVDRITDLMNYIIVCTSLSITHSNFLCKNILNLIKNNKNLSVLGVEGNKNKSGWILIDTSDIVIHIMLQELRFYYQIEKLWSFND